MWCPVNLHRSSAKSFSLSPLPCSPPPFSFVVFSRLVSKNVILTTSHWILYNPLLIQYPTCRCDPDIDDDGVLNLSDNCVYLANSEQESTDLKGAECANSVSYPTIVVCATQNNQQEPTGPGNTSPWLADNQSNDLNNELWLVFNLIRSVVDLLVTCRRTLCWMMRMPMEMEFLTLTITVHLIRSLVTLPSPRVR